MSRCHIFIVFYVKENERGKKWNFSEIYFKYLSFYTFYYIWKKDM